MAAEGRPEEGAGCRLPAGPRGQGGLPIGFRFRPTDEELLLHYLRRKALSCPLPADIIPVADLARLHPSDLPGDADGERYFFHLPATRCWRKGSGSGSCRAGGAGVWRASGKEKLVVASRCGRPVGAKRTLVFCGRGGARTDWAMHEYRLLPAALGPCAKGFQAAEPEDWVVCRVFKKATPAARRGTVRGRRHRADIDMAPSPASSCVTEARNSAGEEEERDGEEIASHCPPRED